MCYIQSFQALVCYACVEPYHPRNHKFVRCSNCHSIFHAKCARYGKCIDCDGRTVVLRAKRHRNDEADDAHHHRPSKRRRLVRPIPHLPSVAATIVNVRSGRTIVDENKNPSCSVRSICQIGSGFLFPPLHPAVVTTKMIGRRRRYQRVICPSLLQYST